MLIRLDSFLSKNGISSRRKAKDLIEAGLVSVNGAVVEDVVRIDPGNNAVLVEGKKVQPENLNFRYIAFYKPLNVLSTTEDEWGRKTVLDFIKVPEKVYPVGRLDYNSTGLLLLTNDGDFALKLTHPRYHVPKKYVVKTREKFSQKQLDEMAQGVEIYGEKTLPVEIKPLGEQEFEIILHQGLKRQIREMCKAVGLRVVELKRVQIGNLGLGDLKQGEFRYLTQKEIIDLLHTPSFGI